MHDCGFTKDKNWFRYRAAAIIIEEGCVLFASNENDDYIYSVGGGVHMGETAEEAVLREVYEETGVHYEIDRLAVIHENFFNRHPDGLRGLECHELTLYFLMKPRGTKELNCAERKSDDCPEVMRWVPIEDLKKRPAHPVFISDYVSREHSGVEHIVTDDRVHE